MDYRLSTSSDLGDPMGLESLNNETLDQTLVSRSFHEAAREGDVCMMEEVLKMIHKSLEEIDSKTFQRKMLQLRINARDGKKMSPLHYATQHNHIKICQLLMDYSQINGRKGTLEQIALDMEIIPQSALDIHAQNHEGATPLHLAARHSSSIAKESVLKLKDKTELESLISRGNAHETCVSKLLEWNQKSVEDIKCNQGMTPLHWAAQKNNIDAAVKLLMFQPRKAEIRWKTTFCQGFSHIFAKNNRNLLNAQDKQGVTALHVCAAHNSTATALLLIEAGADVMISDNYGWTPIQYAVSEGNLQMVKALTQSVEKNKLKSMLSTVDTHQYTPLHIAAEKNQTEIIKVLLDLGDESIATKTNSKGNTALHLAASMADLYGVKCLLGVVENVNDVNTQGRTALHQAAYCNQVEVVDFLMKKGAEINVKDRRGMTALLSACKNGNIQIVKILLQKRDVFVKDKDGMTCLHWASLHNRAEVVKILLNDEIGRQQINKRNHHQKTALHLAAAKGHHKVVELLCGKCYINLKDNKEYAAIHLAAQAGHTKVIKLLLEESCTQILAKCRHKNTPLLMAAKYGQEDAVKFLLENKTNVDQRNSKNYSALSFCAIKDFTKCASVLIEAGASMNFTEQHNGKPLHVACTHGSVNMVYLLLKHNASVSELDQQGNNPLDLAIKHGHKSCVRAIIESPKWKGAVRAAQHCSENGYVTTPLREMIKSMPDMAQLLFSRCTTVSPNLRPGDKEYNIHFDFEFLDDAYSINAWKVLQAGGESATEHGQAPCYEVGGFINTISKPYTDQHRVMRNNHPLAIMIKYDNTELLCHPLVKILLQFKWRKYGRAVYYILLMLYACFLFSLTFYLLAIPPPYAVKIEGSGKNACFTFKEGANPMWKIYNCECCQHGNLSNGFMTFLAVSIGVLASINLIKEGFQMWRTRLAYFRSVDNYLELVSYTLAMIVIIDWSDKTAITGIKEDWQWNMASICLLSSWMTLALFVRKLPTLGIYVIMLLNVLTTFGKFLVTFFLYVAGFGLFFYMMLQNQKTFQTAWQSMVKTTVMMIGELDYASMFFDDGPQDCTDPSGLCEPYSPGVTYPELTTTVYLVFLMLMPIITMNLLVGLAVDDIKSIQDKATTQKMEMQIKLALDVEFLIPEMMRKHFSIEKFVMYPNKHIESNWFVRWFLDDDDFKPESITKLLIAEKETRELLLEQSKQSARQTTDICTKLHQVYQQNKKLHEILTQLTKQQAATHNPMDV